MHHNPVCVAPRMGETTTMVASRSLVCGTCIKGHLGALVECLAMVLGLVSAVLSLDFALGIGVNRKLPRDTGVDL